jgi:hypothetical protein
MTDRRRARARVLPAAALAALAIGALLAACADTAKVLGEECIKSQDCQSGLCESQVCVAAPPFLTVPSANTADSAVEASPPDSSSDTSTTDAEGDGSDAAAE